MDSPFKDGLPFWLRIFAIVFLQTAVMMINGAYVCNGVSLNGSLGLLNEDIAMSYYITSVGAGLTFPIVGMIRKGLGSKAVMMSVFAGQAILCFICAHIETMLLMFICSFALGILKGFAIIEIVGTIIPLYSKRKLMIEVYCFFLPINFAVGQICIMLTTKFAYFYDWRYIYYVSMAILLLSIIVVMLFFKRRHEPLVISFKDIDFPSMAFLALFISILTYILCYGRVLDWFNSEEIFYSFCSLPVLLVLFLISQKGKKNPYLRLEVLSYRKVRLAHFYMFFAMALSGSSLLISNYVEQVLHFDGVYGNSLNIFMIIGFAMSGAFCFWWSRKRPFRFRYLVTISVLSFAAYAALIYFQIRPEGHYETLILPSILRGFAMLTAFIAFGAYSVEDIPDDLKSHNAFFFLTVRSSLAAVAGICVFSVWFEKRVLHYISLLGRGLDAENIAAQSYLKMRSNSAIYNDFGPAEKSMLALNDLYQTVYAQAAVCAIKEIFGYIIIFLLVVAALTALTHFRGRMKQEASGYTVL